MSLRCRPAHLLPALLLTALPAQEQPKSPTQKPAALTAAPAQQPQTQEELSRLRADKLAKEVFHKHSWLTDLTRAQAEAKETGKPIFAYLTRSYAY
jgi:hypothetical protein